MKKLLSSFMLLLFFVGLSSFEVKSEITERQTDCDGLAEFVYYWNLNHGMGQEFSTKSYMITHADCLEDGGTSQF
jgi:hypothetical protein